MSAPEHKHLRVSELIELLTAQLAEVGDCPIVLVESEVVEMAEDVHRHHYARLGGEEINALCVEIVAEGAYGPGGRRFYP